MTVGPDDREERLDKMLNTMDVALQVIEAMREDRAKALTARDHANAFHKQPDIFMGTTFPEQTLDVPMLFEFLSRLICPPVCVGHVNSTGWHQLCERRAQEAIRALGFPPPELTPIPEESK